MDIPNPELSEVAVGGATAQKGSNGLIAEYVCARHLAEKLTEAKLPVKSDINNLRKLETDAVERLKKDMDAQTLQRAINQGVAIGDSMFQSIVNNSQDLIFTDYEFKADKHNFDIINVGAQTNSMGTADLKLVVGKEDAQEVYQEILVSLKAYSGSITSQGSKSSLASLNIMFGDGERAPNAEQMQAMFGDIGIEFMQAVKDFHEFGKDWIRNSDDPDAQAIRKKYADRNKPIPMGNALRGKEVGKAYQDATGKNSAHNLAELYAKLFNENFYKVQKDKKAMARFKEGLMKTAGFDYIVTYNAIADQKGIVSEVVNSNISGGYKKIYDAFANNCDVKLTSKPGSATISVDIIHGSETIKSLSLNMWKDGTIQFKFDSKKA